MDPRAMAMGVIFALIWSSAFTSARVIVTQAPPISALSIRFLLSGLIALSLAMLLGQGMRLSGRQWRTVIIFGICQNTLYLGLNFFAMQTTEASLAAIIASSMPLMVAFFGRVIFGEGLSPLGIIGLLIGFLGVAIIMGGRFNGRMDVAGVIMCIIGAAALGLATLAVRDITREGKLWTVLGMQMLVGAASLAAIAILLEGGSMRAVDYSIELILAFGYTIVFPGLVATWIWFNLVDRAGPVKAAAFHFLTPFIGVGIAALLLGEVITLMDAFGVSVITVGIIAVQMSRQRRNVAAPLP